MNGPGAYGRKTWNRPAKFAYDHVVNPQMLVYLAEAAGVELDLITRASRAALAGRATMPTMSAAIRRVIPWELVEASLLDR